MSKSYFNSSIPASHYKRIKLEAVNLQINVKDHIGNILKSYVEERYPEILDSITEDSISQPSLNSKGEVKCQKKTQW